MLYRPIRGLGLQGPAAFAFGCLAVLAAVAALTHGNDKAAVDLLAWGAFTVWATHFWLWRCCQWVRVDAATLEWRTPLTGGQVPLHEVRKISLYNGWNASIDIRGHRSLDVRVRDGFEDLLAAIVAGAPHVVIQRWRPGPSAVGPNVRPVLRDKRQFRGESAKITDPRDPPVPVWVVDPRLDEQAWPGLLYGWADNPRGCGSGRRGLVVATRPDVGKYIGWALPEHLQQR